MKEIYLLRIKKEFLAKNKLMEHKEISLEKKIKQKPMYDYAEGGITTLRSKYEYKK